MHIRIKLLSLFFVLFASTPSYANDLSEGMEKVGAAVFSDLERRVIREYYHEHRYDSRVEDNTHAKGKKSKSKGAKGKGYHGDGNPKGLPPGIVMKLKRGGVLPPGLAKRNLPVELESGLPPRDRYRRYEVAAQVILVDIITDVIVDIIDIVFD